MVFAFLFNFHLFILRIFTIYIFLVGRNNFRFFFYLVNQCNVNNHGRPPILVGSIMKPTFEIQVVTYCLPNSIRC